jgi:Tol biopolymer transport system component
MKRIFYYSSLALLCSCASNEKAEQTREVKQYTIEQFYKSSQVGGGFFNSDDSKLLVNSNESGIYNAYEIDIASGQKKALTNSTNESIFGNDFVPGTGNFIYNSDKGGNENDHLFLQKSDGSVKDLTPGKNEKAGFWGWSRDYKFLYYTSNKRDPKFFDMYKMDTSTWTPILMYKNETGFDVSAVSDDEKYLALVQPITTSSSNLFILNQQTKEMKKVNSDSTESNNGALQFAMDNKTLYYTTDEGSEYQHVMKYDATSGAKEKFYDTNWDVMYMYTSLNEKYRVIGVNEDGRNKLYVYDHKTGAPVDFP